jgi:hypothetical protein
MMLRNIRALFSMGILVSLVFSGIATPAKAVTLITSDSQLGASIDTFDWSQLGPDYTFLSGPQNVVSADGNTGTVGAPVNQFVLFTQGASWFGNFTTGTALLFNDDVGPNIPFTLANPVSGIGAYIQGGDQGPFVAQITAFGINGNLLGSVTENGVSVGNDQAVGTAIFIGLTDTTADISEIEFSLLSEDGSNSIALGPIETSDVSAVPLPAALPLFGSVLLGLGVLGRRRARAQGTQ